MKSRKKTLRVGIIGCGLIGYKRTKAILELGQDRLAGIYDIDGARMVAIYQETGARMYESWQDLVRDPEIDCVIVAAFHRIIPKIVLEALKNNKHVLAEKPLGNNQREAKSIAESAKKHKKILKVGFNHRFHPAVIKAREIYERGGIGRVMYIRSVYGHGARKDYDLEWRHQPKFTRGGVMYDQGSHIADLSLWFLDPIEKVFANPQKYFWKRSTLEDNAFCQLVSKSGQVSAYQNSLTQWKNRFSVEIYGEKGYLLINGLGRSYGVENLVWGRRIGLGQVPKEQTWEFPGPDGSWNLEWKNFREAILNKKAVMSSAEENFNVMKVIDGLYKSAKTGKLTKI